MTVLVPSLTLDTSKLPEEARFGAFAQAASVTNVITRRDNDVRPFHAHLTAWWLSDIVVTSGVVTACVFERSEMRAKTDGVDQFRFVLLRSGHTLNDTGTVSFTPAGEVCCYDFTRALRTVTTDMDSITVAIARKALTSVMPHVPDLHGVPLVGGSGRLVADHFLGLARYLPSMPAADAAAVARITVALVAAALADLPLLATANDPTGPAHLLARAERYIESHLRSALTPEQICDALSISRSNLYRAFQSRGGVSAFIMKRKLHAAHLLLADPIETRNIAEIADDFDFSNYTHFSSSFRKLFGYSPRDVRSGAWSRAMTTQADRANDVPAAYNEWMRIIGALPAHPISND